jgi:dolichol-phosphate mannosyltransferase
MFLATLSTLTELTEKPIVSLIIPTYNESQNIPGLFARIEKSLAYLSVELIVVDDNSPDGTAEVAQTLNRKYGNVKVCKRSGKLGLSSAVLQGFENASGRILAVIDADLQHPPEILSKMYYEMSKGNDLVIASRYVKGGGIENWKFSRRLFSRGGIILAHMLLPSSRKIEDIMSGCFMVRRDVLRSASAKLNPLGFKILLEILSKCQYTKITEVPYTFTNRINGRSNLNRREIQNYLILLCRLFYYSRIRSCRE